VSSPTNDEDDDEEKMLTLSQHSQKEDLSYHLRSAPKKLPMEDCLDELELEDLKEWVCGASPENLIPRAPLVCKAKYC
jgi:hypothetical protein